MKATLSKLVTVIVVAFASLGLSLGAAEQAHAASSLSGCFVWNTGVPYAGRVVYVEAWNGSTWVGVNRSGKTNTRGCITFNNTPTQMYLRLHAYQVIGFSVADGWSYIYSSPNSGGEFVGNATVFLR